MNAAGHGKPERQSGETQQPLDLLEKGRTVGSFDLI